MPRKFPTAWLTLACLLAAVIHPHFYFMEGWIPHDEGLLAMSARRVLEGEIPHLHFQDAYSGGLSYLHAFAFRFLGQSIHTLRLFHLTFFHLFQGVSFLLLYRVLRNGLISAFAILLVTLWTASNYPASMPSWYVTYLGSFALLVLIHEPKAPLRHRDTLWAGVLSGVAFSLKLTGLYVLLASAFAVLFRTTPTSQPPKDEVSPPSLPLLLTLGALSFLTWIPLLAILGKLIQEVHAFYFFLPQIFLFIAAASWAAQARLRSVLIPWCNLGAGFLAGAAPLLLSYALRPGGLQAFVRGVFIDPAIRTEKAALNPPDLITWLIPIGLIVGSGALFATLKAPRHRFIGIALIILAGISGLTPSGYESGWALLRMIPFVASGLVLFHTNLKKGIPLPRSLWIALPFACWMNLTQYPYSFGTYVLYCVPFFFGLSLPWIQERRAPWTILGSACGAFAVFALFWVNPIRFVSHGVHPIPRPPKAYSQLKNMGISIAPGMDQHFQDLVAEIHKHSNPSEPILVFPDSPEVYFLADRKMPVRWFYDIFSPMKSYREYRELANREGIRTVVIHRRPRFSPPPTEADIQELRKDFPHSVELDARLLLWRSAWPPPPSDTPPKRQSNS